MVDGEGPEQGDINVQAVTTGPFWGCEGSDGLSAEGDDITHCVEGGVAKVRQQGLFIRYPNGELGGKNVIDWLGEPCIVESDITNGEHGRRDRVGRLREG